MPWLVALVVGFLMWFSSPAVAETGQRRTHKPGIRRRRSRGRRVAHARVVVRKPGRAPQKPVAKPAKPGTLKPGAGKPGAVKPAAPVVKAPPPFDPTLPITFPPPSSRFELSRPLPGLAPILIDREMSGGGIANNVARDRRLQARIIWVDATANVEKINSEEKIVGLVAQIKRAGFNTIVLDVKPISGQTLYPSQYAPRLTEWKGQHVLDASFDPLRIMAREAKSNGLSILVSLNAFSEGHQLFHSGPGYDKIAQQTVLYEPRVVLQSTNGTTRPCMGELNALPPDEGQVGIFLDLKKLGPVPTGSYLLVLGPRNIVVAGYDAEHAASIPALPKGGALLIGTGLAGDFLKTNSTPGRKLPYITVPTMVPISERPNRQYPLMMNPNDPAVQDYELQFVRELLSNYPIDGLIYDDRLRYVGLDGDFGPVTQAAFEKFVGHPTQWPTNVYSFTVTTAMNRGISPGPDFDAWLAFRALTLRNYLARVRALMKSVRPTAVLGVYAGSWYGEYWGLGSNWASTEFRAGFWSSTNTYRKTGFARLLDFLITGCYYPIATVHGAMAQGIPMGNCIEAAAALTNRAARDSCWTYSGIALSDFKDNPEGLLEALEAACAVTQGVMVFDLSHDIEPMWPVFAQAFASNRLPPHLDATGLALMRKQREVADLAKTPEAPVIIMAGTSGVGQ
jgi:hypothetical protein